MKYIKKFQTNADYQTFKASSDWITPNVSLIEENVSGNDFNIVFEPFVNIPSGPITFSIKDGDGLITQYTIPYKMTWEEFINSDLNETKKIQQDIIISSLSLRTIYRHMQNCMMVYMILIGKYITKEYV